MKTMIYGEDWVIFANQIENGGTIRRNQCICDYPRVIIANDALFMGA